MIEKKETILEVLNIYKEYKEKGFFKKSKKRVLTDVSFSLKKGECLGIIGESGSGKSTLGRIITGIEKPNSGIIKFNGKDLSLKENKNLFKDMSIVFQDYTSSVNPQFNIAEIISEPLTLEKKLSEKEIKKELETLVTNVGLPLEILNRYPNELSGGQLQRVCIARAISTKPKFLMLDEAVSSLDISTQVEVLDLLEELKQKYELSYIFVTHDLLTITYICDSVIFFKDGQINEKIDNISELSKIKSDYSKSLLNAVIEF
ncbi:MAG: ABC transporter ATP-binding protein [Fusobacterium sp.]|nr:ABC transporter ATP-binding protein [Fusobacterium sp.]